MRSIALRSIAHWMHHWRIIGNFARVLDCEFGAAEHAMAALQNIVAELFAASHEAKVLGRSVARVDTKMPCSRLAPKLQSTKAPRRRRNCTIKKVSNPGNPSTHVPPAPKHLPLRPRDGRHPWLKFICMRGFPRISIQGAMHLNSPGAVFPGWHCHMNCSVTF